MKIHSLRQPLSLIRKSIFISTAITCAASAAECTVDVSATEELKSVLLAGDVKAISARARYPAEVLFAGNKIKIINNVSFEFMWPKIATTEFLDTLQRMDTCELTEVMKINGDGTFSSLVLSYDEEDAKYRNAYISSAKALRQFLTKANDLVQVGNFSALFELVGVPFTLRTGGQDIHIENQQDFIQHANVIFNDSLKQTIEGASLGNGIIINSRGLMLTEDGELWVRQFEGVLKLIFTVVER